jgi:hypothetical protein
VLCRPPFSRWKSNALDFRSRRVLNDQLCAYKFSRFNQGPEMPESLLAWSIGERYSRGNPAILRRCLIFAAGLEECTAD